VVSAHASVRHYFLIENSVEIRLEIIYVDNHSVCLLFPSMPYEKDIPEETKVLGR
jgi:hypothetical protein